MFAVDFLTQILLIPASRKSYTMVFCPAIGAGNVANSSEPSRDISSAVDAGSNTTFTVFALNDHSTLSQAESLDGVPYAE
jgi:hypothetical protein